MYPGLARDERGLLIVLIGDPGPEYIHKKSSSNSEIWHTSLLAIHTYVFVGYLCFR